MIYAIGWSFTIWHHSFQHGGKAFETVQTSKQQVDWWGIFISKSRSVAWLYFFFKIGSYI